MQDAFALLEKNVMRWRHFAPDVALQFLNLPEETREVPEEQGLQEWFDALDLKKAQVLYVYGNAGGKVFKIAQKLLEKDKTRLLVIFEDDIYGLREFLKTDLATEMLHHPQVYLFPLLQSDFKLRQQLDYFLTLPYEISVIPSYEQYKADVAAMFRSKIETYLEHAYRSLGEFLSLGSMFFINYFQNLSILPEALWGNKLFGKFENIPAIICGAGPSLEQSIPYIKDLKDKAVIFAGGTAMNALNAAGMRPHFGAGIDPHIDQYYRILANTAYEVPYFYRNRIHPEALRGIHGEKLFISGAGGYLLPTWIENLLGIEGEETEEGHSVVGFSTALATAMGCNPIIIVGMDLAYTDNKSYSKGIQNHPIHQKRHFFRTKNEEENLLPAADINGNTVLTTAKWMMESQWFSQFSARHPGALILNSTGGGIGLNQIMNAPLPEISELVRKGALDVEGMVFSRMAEALFPSDLNEKAVQKAVNTILDDLKRGIKSLKEIIKKLEKKKDAQAEIKIFEKEPLYARFLLDFERAHADLYKRELFRLEIDKKDVKKEREILLDHYVFLQKVCENLKKIIDEKCLSEAKSSHSAAIEIPEKNTGVVYSMENGRLRIVDKEMGLDIDEEITSPSSGELHGLSVFLDGSGQVLSQTLFLKGKKEGRSFRYYTDGKLAAVLRYRGNCLEGIQKYYYRHGGLRSSLNFKNGDFHGPQVLYYPDGKLKCEFHFVDGLREGEENRWNHEGRLIIEALYHNNQPVGVAKEWFDNGKLKNEVLYSDENPQYCKVKHYDQEGVLLAEEDVEKDDFFDVFARKISILTMNLKGMREHAALLLSEASKALKSDEKTANEIKEKLSVITRELEVLDGLNTKILEAVGLESHAAEPIWKSPQVRSALEEQYSQVADELQKGLDAIRKSLYELVIKMSELKHE